VLLRNELRHELEKTRPMTEYQLEPGIRYSLVRGTARYTVQHGIRYNLVHGTAWYRYILVYGTPWYTVQLGTRYSSVHGTARYTVQTGTRYSSDMTKAGMCDLIKMHKPQYETLQLTVC